MSAKTKELTDRIKPVVRVVRGNATNPDEYVLSSNGFPHYIEPVQPDTSYLSSPSPVPTEPATDLERMAVITTWYPSKDVNPSVREVVSQIPKRFIDKVVAFEIPSTFCDVNNYDFDEAKFGLKTVLYRKKQS